MKLLTSPRLSLWRVFPSSDAIFTFGLIAWLVGLEFIGRVAGNDVQDGGAAVALGLAIALTVARHRHRPIPWMARLLSWGGELSGWLIRKKYDHGIDLRGDPPFPKRVPWPAWGAGIAIVVAGVLAGLGWTYFPTGWRVVGTQTFYLGYLTILIGIWCSLMLCIIAGVYVPVLMFEHRLRRISRDADRRAAELLLMATNILLVAAIACFIPAIVVLGLCGMVMLAAGVGYLRSGTNEPALLWRAGPGHTIYAIPLHRLLAGATMLFTGFVLALLIASCGGRLYGSQQLPEGMPLTALLGSIAAWLVPGAVVLAAIKWRASRRTDPARRELPTVHLHPSTEAAVDAIRQWGWTTRIGSQTAQPGDVRVRIVSSEESDAEEFDPRWPLRVSADDLITARVKPRLARRDEIQQRRRIFRGLPFLFKKVQHEYGRLRGGGFWFAPHWWFVDTLARENTNRKTGEETLRSLGPNYNDVFGVRPRQHLHEVLRALQIDMIFIEDGIGHRTVIHMLRNAFELFDMHGGKRRAEEHHFRGIPRVRVMIHDYSPGVRFKSSQYREPGFDELSRARVLHIFRDRGESEELTDIPFDESWEPAPALGVG